MKRALFIAAFFLYAFPAWATTYYVSLTGNNANSCAAAQSPATAKRHPENDGNPGGLSCLSSTDTLIIRPGTYTASTDHISTFISPFPGGSSGFPTIIKCETHLGCIMDPFDTFPDTAAVFIGGVNWVTISDFVFKDDACVSNQTVKFDGDTDHITMQDSELSNGANGATILLAGSKHSSILRNNIHNTCPGNPNIPPPNSVYGIYSSADTAGMIIDGNEISRSSAWGLHGNCQSGNACNPAAETSYIRNNYFHNNGFDDPGTPFFTDIINYYQTWIIYNNVFANTPGGGINNRDIGTQMYGNTFYNENFAIFAPGLNILKNNLALNMTGSCSIGGTFSGGFCIQGTNTFSNNLCDTVVPGVCDFSSTSGTEFINAALADFHLKSGAVARNNCANLGAPYNVDKDGVPRPNPPTAWDIGAYQFVTATAVPVFAYVNSRRR